jgi:hypothetical protein
LQIWLQGLNFQYTNLRGHTQTIAPRKNYTAKILN